MDETRASGTSAESVSVERGLSNQELNTIIRLVTSKLVSKFTYRLGGDRPMAEDLVHDAIEGFLTNGAALSLTDAGDIKNYLSRAAGDKLSNYRRSARNVRNHVSLSDGEEAKPVLQMSRSLERLLHDRTSTGISPERQMMTRQQLSIVWTAFWRLPSHIRSLCLRAMRYERTDRQGGKPLTGNERRSLARVRVYLRQCQE